jgi:predicted dehydrogenase
LRIGVVGCGLISQVMHLHYLRELDELYEIAALCDLSEELAHECARRYDVPVVSDRWEDLLELEPALDAILVATPGSHAPIAIAAAAAGLHVFVEKPMCINVAEGVDMVEAARAADVRLMVGTMKRYDSAYERLAELLPTIEDLRLVQVTTLESPLEPYVAHYPLLSPRGVDPELLERLAAEDEGRVDAAIGEATPAPLRAGYRNALLDSLVHELNALRGLLGEPDELGYSAVDPGRVSLALRFGELECQLTWVDLPGIARYSQELAFYAPNSRATLSFPSPFLRSAPTRLVLENGAAGGPHAWETVETVGFDEAFRRELVEFHTCVETGRDPRTDGLDGLRDVALCTAIARAAADGGGVTNPSAIPVGV